MLRWPALLAATVASGWALDAAGLPSPFLFTALVAGVVAAIAFPGELDLPAPLFTAAQAVTGVVLGAYLETSSLRAAADAWLPVTLISAGTLGICLVAGLALARGARLDRQTAVLGMIAGGASGIVAMARDLGGDDRLVAFMQYLRVLIVVALTPLIAGFAFGREHSAAAPSAAALFGDLEGWLVTLVVAPVGALLGQAIRLPAGTLLGPLAIAGTVALSGDRFVVPEVLQQAGFIGIGVAVGLRFTPDARAGGRPPAGAGGAGDRGVDDRVLRARARPDRDDRRPPPRRLSGNDTRRPLRRAGRRLRRRRRHDLHPGGADAAPAGHGSARAGCGAAHTAARAGVRGCVAMRGLPPGPEQAPVVQMTRWLVRPISFLEDCRRRYGDTFSVMFPGF